MVVDTNRIEFLNTYIDNLTASEAKNAVDSLIQAGGCLLYTSDAADD